MIFCSCILPWSPALSNEPWGGIYIAHTPKTSRWKKADKKCYHRLNRCSHFCHHRFNRWVHFPTSRYTSTATSIDRRNQPECNINVSSTGECNSFTFHGKPSFWTTAPMCLTGDTSDQPVYVFFLIFIWQCTDVYIFFNIGLTSECIFQLAVILQRLPQSTDVINRWM